MNFPFRDPSLPADQRLADLLGRLTPAEKIALMTNDAKAVPRLGLPEYDWWNECLHGVGRAGTATVFPQAIGLAATFDAPLVGAAASVAGDEARAKHHEAARQGYRRQYQGLTFFSPNVNIFRDPRWGRGQETFGEDPHLSARLGAAFIRGLQGDGKRLKAAATVKHFAVHSGPEALRHVFDARVSERDLRETYLPAFRAAVVEAGAAMVMGAYNRTNGEACCASPRLLGDVLRGEWGFDGCVVSDCGAIEDLHKWHLLEPTAEAAAAAALKAGCDLECGWTYPSLAGALEQGLIVEADLDRALRRSLGVLLRVGWLDPPGAGAFEDTPYDRVDSPAHRDLALRASRESLVLLRNEGGFLPLAGVRSIAVVGPNADNREVLLGNYNGTPSRSVTVLEGLRRVAGDTVRLDYALGCPLSSPPVAWGERPDGLFYEALAAAERADVTVLCLGLGQSLEGEQGGTSQSDWDGDRKTLDLPDIQKALLQAVCAKGKPVVLVLLSGSPVTVDPPAAVRAVVQAWYPGQDGGQAVAELLFGRFSPSGRLPITFPRSAADLPPFVDYALAGRTYRYAAKEPLYPFGFGLSYTTFAYGPLELPPQVKAGEGLTASVTVRNTGARAGAEVVQLYREGSDAGGPLRQLVAFARVELEPGQSRRVELVVDARSLATVDAAGRFVVAHGARRLVAGGRQPDARSAALAGTAVVEATLEVAGPGVVLAP